VRQPVAAAPRGGGGPGRRQPAAGKKSKGGGRGKKGGGRGKKSKGGGRGKKKGSGRSAGQRGGRTPGYLKLDRDEALDVARDLAQHPLAEVNLRAYLRWCGTKAPASCRVIAQRLARRWEWGWPTTFAHLATTWGSKRGTWRGRRTGIAFPQSFLASQASTSFPAWFFMTINMSRVLVHALLGGWLVFLPGSKSQVPRFFNDHQCIPLGFCSPRLQEIPGFLARPSLQGYLGDYLGVRTRALTLLFTVTFSTRLRKAMPGAGARPAAQASGSSTARRSSRPGASHSHVFLVGQDKCQVLLGIFTRFLPGAEPRFPPCFQITGALDFQLSAPRFPRIVRSPSSRNPRFLVRASAPRNIRAFTRFCVVFHLAFTRLFIIL
jgi:hypothetical protein